MTHTITLKNLRPALPKVAEAVGTKYDRYIITKRGAPVMVLINPEDYEGLLETIDILADRSALKRIKRSRKEAQTGKTISLKELRNRLENA